MKFKMPRNSIFAVLLRSPWWISAAIAALLSVGGFAALPLEYAAMGVFAAIPFAVIAIMAAWAAARAVRNARAGRGAGRRRDVLDGFFPHGSSRLPARRLRGRAPAGARRRFRPEQGRPRRHRRRPALEGGARRRRALAKLQAERERRGAREAICIALGEVPDTALQYARANGVSLMQAPELAKLLRDLKT